MGNDEEKPPRITEQDATDLVLGFYWYLEIFKAKHGRNPSLVEYFEGEGNQTLARLNNK